MKNEASDVQDDSLSKLTPGLYFDFPPRQRRVAGKLFASYEERRPTYGDAPHPPGQISMCANSYKRSVMSRTSTGSFVGIFGAGFISLAQGHFYLWGPGIIVLCAAAAIFVQTWLLGNRISAYFGEGYRRDPIAVYAVPRTPSQRVSKRSRRGN